MNRVYNLYMWKGDTTEHISQLLPIDGVNGQDSIAAHVTVSVLQAGSDCWHERLQQLWLLQFTQETQSGATDELIGMLQVLKLEVQFHIRMIIEWFLKYIKAYSVELHITKLVAITFYMN